MMRLGRWWRCLLQLWGVFQSKATLAAWKLTGSRLIHDVSQSWGTCLLLHQVDTKWVPCWIIVIIWVVVLQKWCSLSVRWLFERPSGQSHSLQVSLVWHREAIIAPSTDWRPFITPFDLDHSWWALCLRRADSFDHAPSRLDLRRIREYSLRQFAICLSSWLLVLHDYRWAWYHRRVILDKRVIFVCFTCTIVATCSLVDLTGTRAHLSLNL